MFEIKEVKGTEKNLGLVQTVEETGYQKIKPETDITVEEARTFLMDFINGMLTMDRATTGLY